MRFLCTKSNTVRKKPLKNFGFFQGLLSCRLLINNQNWRRDRDSNPGWAINPCRFSRTINDIPALYKSITYASFWSNKHSYPLKPSPILKQLRAKSDTVNFAATDNGKGVSLC